MTSKPLQLNIDGKIIDDDKVLVTKLKRQATIKINRKAINEKDSIKYLGVLIDSTLSWKNRILNISKNISKDIGIMYKLRPFLPLKVMRNVYYSLIYSHIIYAIEAWGSAFKTELEKILVLQKRAMRLVTYNVYPTVYGPLISTDPIFAKFRSLKVFDICQLQVSKFIFKCINKIAPLIVQNWFSINHERYGYCTRSNINIMDGKKTNNLFIPTARTSNYGMKLLKFKGPRIWNALPNSIKIITSLHAFLKELKVYYISEYG